MELAGLNIKFLPGVGEKKAAVLYEELQVQSYEDMLYHIPFKYIDRSKIYSIAELNGRLPYIQIKAKIRNLKTIGEGKALRMTATAYDETGTLELVWFKGFKFLTSQIDPDKEYLIFGQPSEFNHKLNIVHPEIDSFEKASQLLVGFQAVYPTTEKMKKAFLNSKAIRILFLKPSTGKSRRPCQPGLFSNTNSCICMRLSIISISRKIRTCCVKLYSD